MDIADIETFLMLVRTRNISKTAEKLYVSQPTVSHRLKQLEDELGTPLFVRKRGYKRVELTAKGEAFLSIAYRWLALMRETNNLWNSDDAVQLRIGTTSTLNTTVMSELYRAILRDKSLNLSLNISTHYSYEIYELLENHTIDIGFVYHYLHFKNIISRPILREKMYLVQEAAHAVKKEKLHIAELDFRSEVYFVWESNYQIWHEQNVTQGRFPRVEVDSSSLLSALLQDPGRWAICPLVVMEHLRAHQDVYVSEIADEVQPPERITYVIRSKEVNETKAAAMDLLTDRIRAYFRAHRWLNEASFPLPQDKDEALRHENISDLHI